MISQVKMYTEFDLCISSIRGPRSLKLVCVHVTLTNTVRLLLSHGRVHTEYTILSKGFVFFLRSYLTFPSYTSNRNKFYFLTAENERFADLLDEFSA